MQTGGADIAIRPLAGTAPTLTTFLLRRQGEPSEPMKRFISRVKAIGGAPGGETGSEREPPEPELWWLLLIVPRRRQAMR